MTRAAIVVGAGIGGLTAAHALQRTGWRVDVYEQTPAIAPVGAGIGIAPNAVKALDALGLGHQIRSRGRRQAGMAISDQSGRHLLRLSGDDILRRYGAPFYALHRATLHDILLNQLDAQALHTGHRATAIATGIDSASATFATESEESITATADMVIVADGVQSRLRAALFPEHPGPTYAGYTVWRGHVDAPTPQIQPVLSETWSRRGTRFGIAAIDSGIYWFACENLDEFDAPPHRLDLLADRFHDWHDPIPRLLAATAESRLLRQNVYYLRAPLPSFVHGRIALLGDAAHAVTPDIGQGACLAVEDAAVLAAMTNTSGIDDGLHDYDALRRPRTQRMAAMSGRIGAVAQTSHPLAAWFRDRLTRALPTGLANRAVGGAFGWTPPTAGLAAP